jgi:hypothetical protein
MIIIIMIILLLYIILITLIIRIFLPKCELTYVALYVIGKLPVLITLYVVRT